MKKDDLIDGCYYMIGLGNQGKNQKPFKYVETSSWSHLACFSDIEHQVHVTRIKYLMPKKDYPELYL